MNFSILGPLEVLDGREPLPIGAGRQRKLLAILLLHANEVVTTDRLIDELWNGRPTETAAKALQGLVSQLRRRLGQDFLLTLPSGYLAKLDREELDAHRFEQLLKEAGGAQPEVAARKLREALGLWRGPALADFAYDDFARNEIDRLEELRLTAIEKKMDADLALGQHAELIAELEALLAEHPLRERFRAQLMRALYRAGRQVEALQVYQNGRAAFRDELGLDPSEELQDLQKAILGHDPSLVALPSRVARPQPTAPFERMLRRPRLLLGAGALLLVGAAIVAIGVELTGGSSTVATVVKPNSVVVIDPKTNRVRDAVSVGARPVAVATGPDAVWVANADSGTVSRIDPKRRQAVSTIGIGADVSDVAIGFGSVWVADGNDGTLTRIDPKLNAVQATLRFGPSSELSPQPVFSVATGEGNVWATRGNSVLKIDPATNQTVVRIPISQPLAIAVGAGALWVTTAGERLLRIDADSNTLTARVSLPAQGVAPAVWHNGLWMIVSIGQGNVWRFDPNSLSPTSTFTTATGATDLAVGEGSVWALNSAGSVWRVEPSSGRVMKIALAHRPTGIAAGHGAVWAAIS